VITLRPVTARSASGVMNSVAPFVITVSTRAPAWRSFEASSAALYAAIDPLIPRTMRLPESGSAMW